MKPIKIISAIIIDDLNQILLLKRSIDVKFYRGKWNVISGTLKKGEIPEKCLEREIEEEIGITNYKIIKKGKNYIDKQKEGMWLVYPFLLKILNGKIKLNKNEHDEYKWILINDLNKYDYVPGIKSDFKILGLI